MVPCASNLGWRKLIALALVAATLPLFGASGACAEPAEPIGAAAWRLGDRLSLAAFLFARGEQDDAVERLMSSIKPIAETMGITIAPSRPAPPPVSILMARSLSISSRARAPRPGARLPPSSARTRACATTPRPNPICCSCFTTRRRSRSRRRDPVAHERSGAA